MAELPAGNLSPLQVAARTLAKSVRNAEFSALHAPEQVKLEEASKAMFLAARKPSAAMMKAAQTVDLPHGYQLTELEAMLVWERMVDAAVSEG